MFLFHFSADKQRRVPAYVVLDLGGFVLFVAESGNGAGLVLCWFWDISGLVLFLFVPGRRADLDRRRGQVRGNKRAGFENVRAGGQAKGQREYSSGRSLA